MVFIMNKDKINVISKKIFNIKDSTMQEKILLGMAMLVVLLIGTFILKHFLTKKYEINYKEKTVSNLFEYAISTNDREVYWILNNIINSFIHSYEVELDGREKNNEEYSRKDFYNVLTSEYKKVLSKKEYLELTDNMMKKFIRYNNTLKTDDYIQEVRYLNNRVYPDNMYICKLNTIDSDVESYIGIILDTVTRSYSIFYLE